MSSQQHGKRLTALRFYSRGVTSLNEGKYKKAVRFLSSAIKLGCKTVSAYCELGLARFKLAQIQPITDSDDPRADFYQAEIYLLEVDTNQALEYLDTYIEQHPTDAEMLVFRGNLRELSMAEACWATGAE